jgi:GTP cyclohydrolase I
MIDYENIPDLQHESTCSTPYYINQIGVSNVKIPFLLDTLNEGVKSLTANILMTTDLAPKIKGISMSQLLRTLIKYLDKPLKHDTIRQILEEFKTAVETDSKHSQMTFEFDLPLIRYAPISKLSFPQYYKCSFTGKLDNNNFQFWQKVHVQYASYCCCSASLCDHLKENGYDGYPHAQRSYATLLTKIQPDKIVWLEQLIDLVENSVVNKVYPILKRMDEMEVARIAESNTMFVEDAVRRICINLNKDPLLHDWIIKCDHEESLHTSNAIAICWKGIPGGFDGTYYI